MKFARLDNNGLRVAINPNNVTTVLDGVTSCKVFTTETSDPITISGSFDEVVGALESVDAPPVAPVVGPDPADLERAAKVLDLIADAAGDGIDEVAIDQAIDQAIGANGIEWTDTMEKARALAARLRGRAS